MYTEPCNCELKYSNIEKALVLSTGHVSFETDQLFQAMVKFPFRYVLHDYGYILFLRLLDEEKREQWQELAPELIPIIEMANQHGCSLIDFDRDASLNGNLQGFDW